MADSFWETACQPNRYHGWGGFKAGPQFPRRVLHIASFDLYSHDPGWPGSSAQAPYRSGFLLAAATSVRIPTPGQHPTVL